MEIITTENILNQLYYNPNQKYNDWIEFINKCQPTLRLILNEHSDFSSNDENVAFDFIKSLGVNSKIVDGYKSVLSYIATGWTRENSGTTIAILDIQPNEMRQISEKYGIVCQPLDISVIDNILFQEGVEKSVERGEKNRGWSEILKQDLTKPSNALIFIDRYMFAKDSHGITFKHGVENVYDILNAVLPCQLDISYQVLLAFDASTLDNREDIDFKSITTEVNKLKKRLIRPYNIDIELVSIDKRYLSNYDETHNRRIISNYFLLRLDRSLKAFANNRSLYSQTIWLDWLGSKGIVRQKNSDIPFKAQRKYLKELRKAILTLQKVRDPQAVSFAQNGNIRIPITDIRNRLIKP